MKLRNKKTGEIVIANITRVVSGVDFDCGQTLAELNAEWEDCEPEGWCITMYGGISRISEEDKALIPELKEIGNYFGDKESAYDALDKLKAWKRLKDKGYYFKGWHLDKLHFEIELRVKEYDFVTDELKQDLDLLFGSEIKDQ